MERVEEREGKAGRRGDMKTGEKGVEDGERGEEGRREQEGERSGDDEGGR